jgi:hypothetical protein
MEIALILTSFSCTFLAIWAASLLWKHCASYIYGFIPVLSMVVVGFIMMGVFLSYIPNWLSLGNYILILYGCSILYFIIQLLVVYKIIQKHKSRFPESEVRV